MKRLTITIAICIFGFALYGQTITSTTPGVVQINQVLPITIVTDNANFLQASTSTFVLTQGTNTLYPTPGSLTIVNDNLLWATFDFGAGWLYEGQYLNSFVSNDQDGVMYSANSVLIQALSIEENNFGNTFKAYPNPSIGTLTIALGSVYNDISARVLDISGQVVSIKQFYSAKQINVEIESGPGLYFVEVTSAGKKAIIKVVKE